CAVRKGGWWVRFPCTPAIQSPAVSDAGHVESKAGLEQAQVGNAEKVAAVSIEADDAKRTPLSCEQASNRTDAQHTTSIQPLPSELQTIVETWPSMPEHIRAAIMALVGTVKP
ncbi:MAG: hypothetical protein WCT04_26025, partial [Planctomycetota bacterium]